MNLNTKNSRILSFDIIRIAAVLMVIMIHTAMDFTKYDTGSFSYLSGNIFDSMARAGVPLFVMVSGALLLDEKKEISINKIFSKYIFNIVFLFVIWSCIYSLIDIVKGMLTGHTPGFGNILHNFITGSFHMWYLMMIIGLYLTLPVLKLFVKSENSKIIVYTISLSLVFMFLPQLLSSLFGFGNVFVQISAWLTSFKYGFIGVFPTYFITGWYVKYIGIKHKKTVYLSSVISVLLIILLVQTTGNYSEVYSNSNILVYLYSLGIFTFINDVSGNKSSSAVVTKLSDLTFGVYIVHIIVLYGLDLFFKPAVLTPLSIIIKFCLITVISFAGSYILSKIPGLKKLVRF